MSKAPPHMPEPTFDWQTEAALREHDLEREITARVEAESRLAEAGELLREAEGELVYLNRLHLKGFERLCTIGRLRAFLAAQEKP